MKPPRLTEADFLRQVLALAKLYGWRSFHARPARTAKGWRTAVQGDGAGWPDLILCRCSEIVAAELKVGRNKLTPSQIEWVAALEAVGVPVFLWRPEDWAEIEAVLRKVEL